MKAHRFSKGGSLVAMMLLVAMMSWSLVRAQEETATPESTDVVVSQEDAERFAERFNAIFDGPNMDIADEILSEDFVAYVPLAPVLDREGWKAYVSSFYAAISDLRQEVDEIIISEDRVILRVSYTGTHDGPLFGIPATGNPIAINGVGIFRFNEDGLAVENFVNLDLIGLLAQIGAFPPA